MIKQYLITAAYIKKGIIRYYCHPLDSETANFLLRNDNSFITVLVSTTSKRQAKFIAKEALAKEMSDAS